MQGAGYLLIPRDEEKFAQYKENRKKFAPCPNQGSEEPPRQLSDLLQRALDAEQKASDLEQKVFDANQMAKNADQRAADAEQRTAEKLALQEEQLRAEFEAKFLQFKHDSQAAYQRKLLEVQGEFNEAKDTIAIQAAIIKNFEVEKPVERQSEQQEQERLRMILEDSLATQCELRSKLSETKQSLRVQCSRLKGARDKNSIQAKVIEQFQADKDAECAKIRSQIDQCLAWCARSKKEVAPEAQLKKKCNWDHESHYASNEIQVVNGRKKEAVKNRVT